ncbi:MAG: TIGR01244 family sulfur transferase [Acinetobacter sp.]|nr:TIGR01244 family sulfur transferase [Acinetobacter sp.]
MTHQIAFAGQIAPEHIAQVVEQGYKSIICNRPDFEGGAEQPTSQDIQTAAEQAGLSYVHQPVVAGQISEKDVQQFAEHYNALPKPVLVFCRTGNRSNNLYQLAVQMDLLDDE